ncbi:Uncharacterised protein [Mycobacteroides abscessus subsp. abscessus]|nr:Uncharacterised protein [Mycobacteroides abscessus subsp. abscessus]
MQPPPGMSGQGNQLIVGAVTFQVYLDIHLGGKGRHDRVDRRDRRGVADQEEPRRKVRGHLKARGSERHDRDGHSRLCGYGPLAGGAGRFMDHDVDAEFARIFVGGNDRVRALMLAGSPIGIGEPESEPFSRGV